MNEYPEEYPSYSPASYQALQWQGILGTLMGVAVLVAVGAWALSVARKALKGEDVEFPL
jgi:hypothetical protein